MKMAGNVKKAAIILHEIYGVNDFIEGMSDEFIKLGFDVFCPRMYKACFTYSEADKAYEHFLGVVGFDYSTEVEQFLEKLKVDYAQVLIVGFSVGATVAWRCCENSMCDGIICFYGSRIRDYPELKPACPVLLLFAERDSFDVVDVISQLAEKANAEIHSFPASHGFVDQHSENYDKEQAIYAMGCVNDFLMKHFSKSGDAGVSAKE